MIRAQAPPLLDYELPQELIAQHPPAERGESQLMVLAPDGVQVDVGTFGELFFDQLHSDDLVVVNDSRVLHARLRARRPGGGSTELLLLHPLTADPREAVWEAMVRPARRMRDGMQLVVEDGATVTAVRPLEAGTWAVRLPVPAEEVAGWLEAHGELPLPPYITPDGQDPARYQTVYAQSAGSVAAPTAGLHFDERAWERLHDRHDVARVTLHVGAGTFLPVRDGDLAAHVMHAERYDVPVETDRAVRAALANGRRIVAIGTTSVRVLEAVYGGGSPRSGSTQLFIKPGYSFACVGAMLTNFHLPNSTLLSLVMAFAGEERVRAAYDDAVRRRMRFYSFGDAMFIHPQPGAGGRPR